MSNIILDVKGLCKSFKNIKAVDNVTFQVEKGEVMGFLGPNGAGKTTTIRIITGLSKADSGEVIICNNNITNNFEEAMINVGAIVETPHLYENMTGMENIKLFSGLYPNVSKESVDKAIEISGLKNRLGEKVKNYSLGMKQRIGLAVALLHNPSLLILDEPTNGLDPAGIRAMRDFLKDLAHNHNVAVLVSSHILSEMQLLCDRVAIISNGQIKCIETMENITDNSSLEDLFINATGGDNII